MKINPHFAARHGKHLLVHFIGFKSKFTNISKINNKFCLIIEFKFPKTGNIIVPELLKDSESTLSSFSELTKDSYSAFRCLRPAS